jgi:tripartite-type tricarboxylate transporter receptor subunit TctC
MIAKRHFLGAIAAACCALSAAGAATAQTYPKWPIKFVVPYPAGGSTDVAARVVAQHLSRAMGQQVFIENRSGAAGVIGLEAVAKSPPDGYTILVTTDFLASAAHVYKLNIDPLKDLIPVIQLARQPVVLAVHPALGVNSLVELVALAKQRPGLKYATGGGAGAEQHIVAEWTARVAGIKLEQVPYRGGAQAINDLIAGHVKVGWLGSTPLIPHYKAGTLAWRIRAGGNTARHRGAAQRRNRKRACRSGDPREVPASRAGAHRRQRHAVRSARAR